MIGIQNNELKRLYQEDIIWYIYFFIIAFYLYSNHLEESYLKNKDENIRKRFRKINEIVYTIVLIIYIYFLVMNLDRLKELDKNCSSRRKRSVYLSILISILFIISGVITLYLSFESEILDNEIGII